MAAFLSFIEFLVAIGVVVSGVTALRQPKGAEQILMILERLAAID